MRKDLRRKSILVTGGLGFIGSHLVEELVSREAMVTVVDNGQSGSRANLASKIVGRVAIREADVRDEKAMKAILKAVKPSLVFHLAANASVPASVADPVYDFMTNTMGTVVLLNQLRVHAPDARMVLASSGAVYGEPRKMPIRESSALAPISPYGASKMGAETECRAFHRVYGVDVVIARIFNTYGPKMPRFVVLDFLRKLQRNPKVLEILGNGRQVRDFNFVDDTVHGLLILAESGKAGEAYNLASGQACSVKGLARNLLKILGLEKRTRLAFTGKSWKGDAQHWEVDTSKISKLGYHPETALNEGLKQVIEWFDGRKLRVEA